MKDIEYTRNWVLPMLEILQDFRENNDGILEFGWRNITTVSHENIRYTCIIIHASDDVYRLFSVSTSTPGTNPDDRRALEANINVVLKEYNELL